MIRRACWTLGSLFSGIGGLELGLERAGFRTRWQVENDPFAASILERHWPHVRRFGDIRTIGADLEPVHLIAGGFPCQDISAANRHRRGLAGERSGLWQEFQRIVDELRPPWVLIENSGRAWRSWVPFVRRDLFGIGYASLPLRMRASDFGAPHERSRVFIVASADADRLRELQREGALGEERRWPRDCTWWTAEPSVARVVHGVPRWVDSKARTKVLGNAVCPPIAEWLGWLIRRGMMAS